MLRFIATRVGLALLLGACAAPSHLEADGPLSVVRRNYERLAPGADWAALRADYADDAQILRLSAQVPGGLVAMTPDEWFAEFPAQIDAKDGFAVEIVGSRTTLYDRIATVWVTAEVTENDVGKEPITFRTVEQVSLVLGPDERWQITQVLYQGESDHWPPAENHRRQVYTSTGAQFEPDLRFRVSNS